MKPDDMPVVAGSEAARLEPPAAPAAERWTMQRVLWVKPWSPTLFSFATSRSPEYDFIPGQFARLGVATAEGPVWRAYSLVARPEDDFLEFFSVIVPNGAFTSRLSQMRSGDEIMVDKTSYGFLTTERFADGRDLWLLGSGTGIGPFISILRSGTAARFENAVLVHSVRRGSELAYREEIAAMRQQPGAGARLHYVPVVTREPCKGALAVRIPQLIESGRLQQEVSLPLDLERSRLMICGNPEMAAELRSLLGDRGFRVGRRAQPGQLAFENYW